MDEREEVLESYMLASAVPVYLKAARNATVTEGTVARWIRSGLRKIRLEASYIGGRPYVSRESLERFFAAVSATRSGKSVTDQPAEI